MNDRLIFIALLLCIIVLTAIIGRDSRDSRDKTEPFSAPSRGSGSVDNPVLLTKSYTYFPFVSSYFMSDSSTNNSLLNLACEKTGSKLNSNCIPLRMFKFLPTYLDAMCSLLSTTEESQDECARFYVDNNTWPDPYYYDSALTCTSLSGSMGEEIAVRIMNNNYTFVKRCISIHIDAVSTLSGANATALYELKLKTGRNYALLALLRPCMIMFPGIGLFKICLFKGQEDSIMTNFSNKTITSPCKMYLKPVVTPAAPNMLYPNDVMNDNYGNITLFNNKSASPTIYYFNYKEPADYFATAAYTNTVARLTLNTVTLVFDQNWLKNNSTTTLSITSRYSFNACTQIKYTWDSSTANFNVTIGASMSTSGYTASISPDFKALVNGAASRLSSVLFHIVVTYSVDMLTIAGFFKDLTGNDNSSNITMVQFPVASTDTSQAIYLQYEITDINADVTGNAAACPQSVVPNMAAMAKQLGYSL